jgi:DNA-binding transcriptional MerR regulator
MERLYEAREVCKITGVNSRTLLNWTERRLITPTVEAEGSGVRRKYSFDKIIEIKIMSLMVNGGFRMTEAKKIIKTLEISQDSPLMMPISIASDPQKIYLSEAAAGVELVVDAVYIKHQLLKQVIRLGGEKGS